MNALRTAWPDPAAPIVPDWRTEDETPAALPETFALVDLALWAKTDPEPREWALDKLVPKGEVTLFTGPGGVGKSLFAQQLATAHAARLPLLSADTAGGATLYLTAEDDERELHWRQAHIARALHVPIDTLAGKLYLASLRGRLNNELCTFDGEGRLRTAPAYALLRATIEATGAKLVILDNVAHLFAGNENDRGQVTAFANLLNALCRDLGTTIILVGHPNKAGDDYSGSTAWLNAVRSQITLRKPEDCFDHDERVLTLGKANYARQGEQLAFRWHNFAFVLDDDLPPDQRAEIAAVAQANGENQAFMRCLAAATDCQRAVSHNPGSNYAPKVFAVMPEGKKLSEQSYRAAMERLLHIGEIRLDQPLWRKPRRGCNPDGTPLDPDHPWHEKSLRAEAVRPTTDNKSQLVYRGRPNG